MPLTNAARSERAFNALLRYGEQHSGPEFVRALRRVRRSFGCGRPTENDALEVEALMSDLLADLQHFGRRHGVDVARAQARGANYHSAELHEEQAVAALGGGQGAG